MGKDVLTLNHIINIFYTLRLQPSKLNNIAYRMLFYQSLDYRSTLSVASCKHPQPYLQNVIELHVAIM